MEAIFDEVGRFIAGPQPVYAERAPGPWDANQKNDAFAVYCGEQSDFAGGFFSLYNVVGGERDKSTVSAETLRELGISVPVAEAA
jgi:hypothetical protein